MIKKLLLPVIGSNQSILVDFQVTGLNLSAFVSVSTLTVQTEGDSNIQNKLFINVLPQLCSLTLQNCTDKLIIHNESLSQRFFTKGLHIGNCISDYE